MKQARIYIDGMTCINCQIRIENELKKEPALTDISVSYETGEASFSYNPNRISLWQITDIINKMGYSATSEKEDTTVNRRDPADCCTVWNITVSRDSELSCTCFACGFGDELWNAVCDRTAHFRTLYRYVWRYQSVPDIAERYI